MSFIEFDGFKIFYRIKGQGTPLLFGHSYLWDSDMWNEVTESLQHNFTCITVDLPGHGRSEAMENVSLDILADLHKAVMQHLGFSSFSLAGLSIGGMWGSLLCLDEEVNVQKFIILNSSLSPEPESSKELYLGMLKLIESAGHIPEPLIEQIAPGFFSDEYRSEHIDSFKESLRHISADRLKTVTACGRAFVKRGDLLSSFKKYKHEVLAVAGKFDHYRSVEEADLISSAFNSETRIVPSGHISAKEIPLKISEIITEFLS